MQNIVAGRATIWPVSVPHQGCPKAIGIKSIARKLKMGIGTVQRFVAQSVRAARKSRSISRVCRQRPCSCQMSSHRLLAPNTAHNAPEALWCACVGLTRTFHLVAQSNRAQTMA